MAVTQVIEHKRDSSRVLKQDGEYLVPATEETRYFQIVLDNPDIDFADIYNHASIPKLYEAHPHNSGVICKKVTPKQRDDDESYIIDVQVDYDDEYTGEDPENPEDNDPLNRPVIIRGGFAEYEQVMIRDINGVLIRNSAWDAFDPPVTRKAGSVRFSMTKNYATLNLPLLRSYKNAINSDTWMGFAPEVIRIANIGFERVVENVEGMLRVFWPHTFDFEIAEEEFGGDGTWRKYILDAGMRYWDASDETYFAFSGSDGLRATEPQLLNGVDGGIGDRENPIFLPFNLYRPLPFATLNLV